MNVHEKTVFQLNSEAITSLQEGSYPDAIAKLQNAMTRMRMTIQDPSQPGFRLVPIEGYGSQSDNEVLEDVSIISVPARKDQDDFSSSPMLQDTLFRTFDMAFISVFLNYQGQRGIRLTCAFLSYNLGMCFHHREVSNGTMRPEKLRIALKFYTRALRIIDGAFDDGRLDDMTVLLLAIFTNMGHLYHHFGNDSECLHCLTWIRNLLSCTESWALAQTRSDMAFFYDNSPTMVDNAFNKAAAA